MYLAVGAGTAVGGALIDAGHAVAVCLVVITGFVAAGGVTATLRH